ncbi:MAG: DUF3098 domain-containing protein [Bacteroidaceae bacterium]|nr:DUF3098 domain-containing protein [Bacteroidaceae bacterium]
MDRNKFAFEKINFILTIVGVIIIFIGFLLMSGKGTTQDMFNPDVFSTRRIVVAPIVTLLGFLTIIVAIMYQKKGNSDNKE